MPPNTVSSVKAENTSIYDSSNCERSYMRYFCNNLHTLLPVSGLATDAQTRNHAHSQQQTPPSPTPRTAPATGIDAEHRNAYTTPPSDSPPSATSPTISYTKYAPSSSSTSSTLGAHHNLPAYTTSSFHHRHSSNNTRSSSDYPLVESTPTPMMTEPTALSFSRTVYNNNILSLDKSSMYVCKKKTFGGGKKGENQMIHRMLLTYFFVDMQTPSGFTCTY